MNARIDARQNGRFESQNRCQIECLNRMSDRYRLLERMPAKMRDYIPEKMTGARINARIGARIKCQNRMSDRTQE